MRTRGVVRAVGTWLVALAMFSVLFGWVLWFVAKAIRG